MSSHQLNPKNNIGSNVGLAGRGMGHKIEAGCGTREISRGGYGMKISWRDRNALISIVGMRDSFEIDIGMRNLNSKSEPLILKI